MDNETQIRHFLKNWAKAVRSREIEGILVHHPDNFVMFDVPPPFQSVGLDAYRNTWNLFFQFTKPGVFDFLELDIVADENIGFAYARMQCADKSNTPDYVLLQFRLTVGLEKINGQWMILHEHHSIPAVQ